MSDAFATDGANQTELALVSNDEFESWREALPALARQWVDRLGFTAKPQETLWLPGDDGAPQSVVCGWNGKDELATLGGLPFKLPEGDYALTTPVSDLQVAGWALGAYRFADYKAPKRPPARLVMPASADAARIERHVAACNLARDLINTPAGDMLPSALAAAALAVGAEFGAQCTEIVGDELLAQGCATIHAVGRAATDAPRLVDMTWGAPDAPKVTIVGKGVTFDSGGLDIKPASGMRWMKKDMGGAANALGLARLIMSEQLPVRLRLLLPCVENAIAGNAYRPGDVIRTKSGITVEIDNTDAEGRLIMCDALALAAEESPEILVDYATLTGSARSAVGTEIAAMFTNTDRLATEIKSAGDANDDAVWHMPLHEGYAYMLDSKIADAVNSAASPFAGAITAALFLKKFVRDVPWVHFDINGFNTRTRPGRPEGGEAMGMRAVYGYLERRYA